MPAVFLLCDENEDASAIEAFTGDAAVLVVVADRTRAASHFDDFLNTLRARAERHAALLQARGINARVEIAWGTREEAEQQWRASR